jgi:hypothetical protein
MNNLQRQLKGQVSGAALASSRIVFKGLLSEYEARLRDLSAQMSNLQRQLKGHARAVSQASSGISLGAAQRV